jgi:hypothetical protein
MSAVMCQPHEMAVEFGESALRCLWAGYEESRGERASNNPGLPRSVTKKGSSTDGGVGANTGLAVTYFKLIIGELLSEMLVKRTRVAM